MFSVKVCLMQCIKIPFGLLQERLWRDVCFARNPVLCFPSYFWTKTSTQGLLCLKYYSLFPFRFSSLHKFNPQPWNSLLIFLVMMRGNSWTILQTLLTVLSSYFFFPPLCFSDSPWLTLSGYCLTCQLTLFQLPAVLSFHAMDCSLHYSQTRAFTSKGLICFHSNP